MDSITLLGIVAASCTSAAFIPQSIQVMRTRDTQAISLHMYILFTAGIAMWLGYGIAILSIPIISANIVSGVFSLIILILKIKHG
jgi:MtN3 and saliva related transmembrane protein